MSAPNSPHVHGFGRWEEVREHNVNPRRHREHAASPQAQGIKPTTLLLCGDGTNHWLLTTFFWEEDFEERLFLWSSGHLPLVFLFQESHQECEAFAGHVDVSVWRLLVLWLQPQSTPFEALPSSSIALALIILSSGRHPCSVQSFSYHTFLFQSIFRVCVCVLTLYSVISQHLQQWPSLACCPCAMCQ